MRPPVGRIAAGAVLLAAAGVLLAAGAVLLAAGAGAIEWRDEDWSGGAAAGGWAIDADIHPGLLVLENDPSDMRYVAQPTAMRGVYAMAVYHDTLFLGAGPYPITAWDAEVVTYDYLTGELHQQYEPPEQGLTVMKVFGDTLYMPGPETENTYLGGCAVYLYNGDGWINKQEIALALHAFDLEVLNGAIYVTTGDRDQVGSVRVSTDHGETFTNILQLEPGSISRRFYGIGSHQGRIYAQPDGYEPGAEEIYAYDGAVWDTIPVPGLPPEGRMGMFITWGDSLLLGIKNRLFIFHEDQLYSRTLPFSGDRWCRGFHIHGGTLYGGADQGRLYRWEGGSTWTQLCQLGLEPESEEISVLATYYGRLWVATARYEGYTGGRLYVSAAAPHGQLTSLPHDFGCPTTHGALSWVEHRPPGSGVRLRVRSAPDEEGLGARPFLGPDGSSATWYVSPGPLPFIHHGDRWFQYQIELICPEGLEMPFVDRVVLTADSLDVAGLPAAGRPAPHARIALTVPHPNPAVDALTTEVQHAGAATTALLRVMSLDGRLVRSAEVRVAAGGARSWVWDLRDQAGEPVPAGLYLLRATLPDGTASTPRAALVLPRAR